MILGGIHKKGSTDLDTYFISFSFQLAYAEQLFNFIFKFSFTSGPILYFISFSFHLRTPSEITTLVSTHRSPKKFQITTFGLVSGTAPRAGLTVLLLHMTVTIY